MDSIIDLMFCDDDGLSLLLSVVGDDLLILTLSTAPDELKNKLFNFLSRERVKEIQKELKKAPSRTRKEINISEHKILLIAKALALEGKLKHQIVLTDKNDDQFITGLRKLLKTTSDKETLLAAIESYLNDLH